MDETLRQLGGLLLGSVPTIVFILLLFGLYTALVHKPLTRVLSERSARTQGAIQKAHESAAAAEARTAEYEQKLKEARLALFKAQEMRRARAAEAKAAVLGRARDTANAHVEQARAAIERDKLAAKGSLDMEAGRLASEIVRVVLESAMAQAPAGGR